MLMQDGLCPKRQLRAQVAAVFGVDETRMIGRSRLRELVIPRQMAMLVMRERFPEMSYPRIARLLGGRDHSTIMHGVQVMRKRIARDSHLRRIYEHLLTSAQVEAGAAEVFVLPREPHDAHVWRWRVEMAFLERQRLSARLSVRAAAMQAQARQLGELDKEFREALPSDRTWCAQCDRAVAIDQASRCRSRFCSLGVV